MNDWKRLEAEQRVERVTPIRALLRRRKGACVVCGGPYPDGTGCEFCPAVDELEPAAKGGDADRQTM